MFRYGTPWAGARPGKDTLNDYVGTVAADDAEAVRDQPSLYELANIDRDLYTIVAIDSRRTL
jgi:hypothetical protein